MSSSLNKVKIVNMALSKIGASRISSLNDNAEEARTVNAVYDIILEEILTEHRWSFAQKRILLSQLSVTLAHDEDGMEYVYAKPVDFLKLNFLNSSSAVVKIEENGILSNESGLGIIYTALINDPTKYPPQFVTALATRLAAEVCFPLTESANKAEALFKEYEGIKLPRAISADSTQGSADEAVQDEWEKARLSAGGWLAARSGDATWHPCE